MFSEEKLTSVSNFKSEDQGSMFLQNVATHLVTAMQCHNSEYHDIYFNYHENFKHYNYLTYVKTL